MSIGLWASSKCDGIGQVIQVAVSVMRLDWLVANMQHICKYKDIQCVGLEQVKLWQSCAIKLAFEHLLNCFICQNQARLCSTWCIPCLIFGATYQIKDQLAPLTLSGANCRNSKFNPLLRITIKLKMMFFKIIKLERHMFCTTRSCTIRSHRSFSIFPPLIMGMSLVESYGTIFCVEESHLNKAMRLIYYNYILIKIYLNF